MSRIGEQEYGAVHGLYAQGMAKKQLARMLGLDPKTVRKWLHQPLTRQQRRQAGKVEPWREFLEGRGPEWDGLARCYTGSSRPGIRGLLPPPSKGDANAC